MATDSTELSFAIPEKGLFQSSAERDYFGKEFSLIDSFRKSLSARLLDEDYQLVSIPLDELDELRQQDPKEDNPFALMETLHHEGYLGNEEPLSREAEMILIGSPETNFDDSLLLAYLKSRLTSPEKGIKPSDAAVGLFLIDRWSEQANKLYWAGNNKKSGEIKSTTVSQVKSDLSMALQYSLFDPCFNAAQQQQYTLETVNQAINLERLSGQGFEDWKLREKRMSEYAKTLQDRLDDAGKNIVNFVVYDALPRPCDHPAKWKAAARSLFPGFYEGSEDRHDSICCDCKDGGQIVTLVGRHPTAIPTGTLNAMSASVAKHLQTHYQACLESWKADANGWERVTKSARTTGMI